MEEIIESIRKNWNNKEALGLILIDIIQEYRRQSRIYADAVLSEASTFISEMETGFKPSVTKAEYTAKESIGNSKVVANGEIKALEMIFEAVSMNIVPSCKK